MRIIQAIAPLTEAMHLLFEPRLNIKPTQDVPVVRADKQDQPVLSLVHWGLIPSWAGDVSIGNRMINARAETAAQKPAFAAAMARRRCLVPADGFYEWKKTASGKQPMLIQRRDASLFCFAGLWERWRDPSGKYLDSMTILTTAPNALLRQIHDRMPVIINPGDYLPWLHRDTSPQQVQALLQPWPADDYVADPVAAPGVPKTPGGM